MILEQQRGRGTVTGIPQAFGAARPPAPVPALPAPAQPAVSPAPVRQPQPSAAAAAPQRGASVPPQRNKTAQYLDAIFSGLSGRGSYDQSRYDAMDERAAKEHRAAQMADPTSAESMAMRKRLGPMLAQLGMRPDELEQLSGEDLQAVAAKGDLIAGVMDARGKAAAAKAKAAADAAALKEEREYEEGREESKAKRSAAEWDRQNAIEAPQRLERARTIGGMASGRMIQGALLQDELQRGRAGEADQRKKEAEGREEARKVRELKAKAEQETETKLINEELSLDKLEKKLSARKPDEALPGQGNVVERALIGAKAKVAGGSGMSPDDTSLDTDLTAAGLQAYIGTAGNAPNSEREQNVAATLFRGNGTVGSALQRVRERKAEIARKKAALKARVAGVAEGGAPVVDTSGDEWEDVP